MASEEMQEKLKNLQQTYSKLKKYLEWTTILEVYARNEDIPVNIDNLKSRLEISVSELEKTIPELSVKLKELDKKGSTKKSKTTSVRKDKDYQHIENLKFNYENHNRSTEVPLLYYPEKGMLITKSLNQLILYLAPPETISLKGKTFYLKDTPKVKETALIQSASLNINQIKEKIKELNLTTELDINEIDLKFCLIIGRL